MMWFETLTGFEEENPNQVRNNLYLKEDAIISRINGKKMIYGKLEIPSLAELREQIERIGGCKGKIFVHEIIADIQNLHTNKSNSGSLFQVASQFNLLEMTSPSRIPEEGVGIYEYDHTQGPACAISAGAGTIYRNYFVPVKGKTGQSENNQIDCLTDLGNELGNTDNKLWQMRNGYALASKEGLINISNRIRDSGENELDDLRKFLRIGIQWNTQVTLGKSNHLISQAYCSALPVSYSNVSSDLWEDFARLILEASYEATLCASVINWSNTGKNHVFFTLLGGGAFGNRSSWIIDSIINVIQRYKDWNLDVAIVSHRGSNPELKRIVEKFR